MFKQFTENINANQAYLLFSLGIFFVFFYRGEHHADPDTKTTCRAYERSALTR